MHNLPNPQDLDVSLFLLCVIVLLIIRGIWWVEDHVNRTKARERKLVDDVKPYRTPKQRAEDEAEINRWLYEGEG